MGVDAPFIAFADDGTHRSGAKDTHTLNPQADTRVIKPNVINHRVLPWRSVHRRIIGPARYDNSRPSQDPAGADGTRATLKPMACSMTGLARPRPTRNRAVTPTSRLDAARRQQHCHMPANAALLDHYAAGPVVVRSADSAPADTINPAVAEVTAEIVLDLSKEFPKPLPRSAVGRVLRGCG